VCVDKQPQQRTQHILNTRHHHHTDAHTCTHGSTTAKRRLNPRPTPNAHTNATRTRAPASMIAPELQSYAPAAHAQPSANRARQRIQWHLNGRRRPLMAPSIVKRFLLHAARLFQGHALHAGRTANFPLFANRVNPLGAIRRAPMAHTHFPTAFSRATSCSSAFTRSCSAVLEATVSRPRASMRASTASAASHTSWWTR